MACQRACSPEGISIKDKPTGLSTTLRTGTILIVDCNLMLPLHDTCCGNIVTIHELLLLEVFIFQSSVNGLFCLSDVCSQSNFWFALCTTESLFMNSIGRNDYDYARPAGANDPTITLLSYRSFICCWYGLLTLMFLAYYIFAYYLNSACFQF